MPMPSNGVRSARSHDLGIILLACVVPEETMRLNDQLEQLGYRDGNPRGQILSFLDDPCWIKEIDHGRRIVITEPDEELDFDYRITVYYDNALDGCDTLCHLAIGREYRQLDGRFLIAVLTALEQAANAILPETSPSHSY